MTYELKGQSGYLHRGHVAVLASDGGTFRPAVHYGTGSYPRALAVAAFVAGGKTDPAVGDRTSSDVRLLLNGPGTPAPQEIWAGEGAGPGASAYVLPRCRTAWPSSVVWRSHPGSLACASASWPRTSTAR